MTKNYFFQPFPNLFSTLYGIISQFFENHLFFSVQNFNFLHNSSIFTILYGSKTGCFIYLDAIANSIFKKKFKNQFGSEPKNHTFFDKIRSVTTAGRTISPPPPTSPHLIPPVTPCSHPYLRLPPLTAGCALPHPPQFS